jgi:uncharacterized protein
MSQTAPPPRPLPHPGIDTAPFWEGCAAGELRVQRCDGCGHHRFPPAPLCPRCLSQSATWVTLSGRGRVRSAVTFRQLYHPAFAAMLPYTIGVVDLDEGPSLYAPVPATARAGDDVRVVFDPAGDGIALPRFVAA